MRYEARRRIFMEAQLLCERYDHIGQDNALPRRSRRDGKLLAYETRFLEEHHAENNGAKTYQASPWCGGLALARVENLNC